MCQTYINLDDVNNDVSVSKGIPNVIVDNISGRILAHDLKEQQFFERQVYCDTLANAWVHPAVISILCLHVHFTFVFPLSYSLVIIFMPYLVLLIVVIN